MSNFFARKLRTLAKKARKLNDRLRGVEPTALTHAAIAKLVGRSDPTILDIGCNDGADTAKFLDLMPRAKLFCFEPDPRAVARFNEKLGRRRSKVELFEIALSDRTGQIDFHMSSGDCPGFPQGWDRSGSIRRPAEHTKVNPWITFENTIRVDTRRLDDWAAERDVRAVDFIWMDVQGAEADVISGGLETLRRTRYLYTEYSDQELYEGQQPLEAILALLPTFEVMKQYPGDVLLRNRAAAGGQGRVGSL